MTDTLIEYRYRRPTELRSGPHPVMVAPRGRAVDVASDGGGVEGTLDESQLFSGLVESGHVVAAGLLGVARVAATRYYTPGSMVAAKINAADPVVTADGERLRFESLSLCSGVYARLDLLPDGLEATHHGVGTTNVNLNAPTRRALEDLVAGEPLSLDVGEDEIRFRTLEADVVERRVPLPERWIRSFAELHVDCVTLEPRLELSAAEARRLVAGFPSGNARASVWLVSTGRSVRQVHGPTPGAVAVSGPERLGALVPLFRHARRVRVFGRGTGRAPSSTAWVVDLAGARMTLVLSPEVTRGFSGEGGVLGALVDREEGAINNIASGCAGYDIAEGVVFERRLPFPMRSLDQMHPRLETARRLVASGSVRGVGRRFEVTSGDTTHVVSRNDADDRCTCTWWARHQGERGPCSHVLAVQIVASEVS